MVTGINNSEKYVIYGADAYGEIALAGLKACGVTAEYFLDRKLAGNSIQFVNVLYPDNENLNTEYCYIVAVGGAYDEVCRFLQEHGCNKQMNLLAFFDMDLDESNFSGKAKEFWFNKHLYKGLIYTPQEGEIYIPHVDFCTTEFCSLKCRNCSQLIPYYPSPQMINMEYSLKCFERFLSAIDYVTEVRVLGGEPFCNKETYKVIEYLNNHPKIGKSVIYTNGTIIPEERMLKDLNAGMAIVHISDYGASRDQIEKLKEVFNQYPNIQYFIRSYDNWMDLGDTSLREYSAKTLKKIYDTCNQRTCKHFHNDRFYSCPRVASLYHIGLCGNEHEWVDFSDEEKSTEDYRKKVSVLLDSETPYEACARCNGSLFAKPIPAGEQNC